MDTNKIPVLFTQVDSNYNALPECDTYDILRNALSWPGGSPFVAHPPCQSWGRLRSFSKFVPGAHWLAVWSVLKIRREGGVLEHPAKSSLWRFMNLPQPGAIDSFGGFTVCVSQRWFGHVAEKKTFLYICGILPQQLPDFPICFDLPKKVIGSCKAAGTRPVIATKRERSYTPIEFAKFMVEIVKRIKFEQNKKGKAC